jgi:hypothetical protein
MVSRMEIMALEGWALMVRAPCGRLLHRRDMTSFGSRANEESWEKTLVSRIIAWQGIHPGYGGQ